MDDTDKLDRARDIAFRGIGRNVVAFQKMEAMLKFLIANHKIQGLPEQLMEIKERNRREVDRQTMGSLVDRLFRSVVVDTSTEPGESDAPEGAASVTFSVELDAESHDETRDAFRLLVHERNRLIHQMLVSFNPNSLDSCQAISDAMGDQRARLKPHLDNLKSIVKAISEGQKELLNLIDSEDFPRIMEGSLKESN